MDETGRIGGDVPCVRCGYDLRERGGGDACPECGLGVERSVAAGQALRDSRPAWIRSLAWGAGLLMAAHLMLPVAWVVGAAGEVFIRQRAERTGSWELYGLSDMPFSLAFLLVAVLHWAACWLLTRPENPYARVRPSRWLSRALLLCGAAPLLWALTLLGNDLIDYQWWFRRVAQPRWQSELRGWAAWALVLYLPCPLFQLLLLRRLAVRVLNRRLLEHATIVGIGYPLAAVSLAAAVWILNSFHRSASVLASPVGFSLTLLSLVAAGLFVLWAIYLYGMCMRAFGGAARETQAAWLAADRGVEAAKG